MKALVTGASGFIGRHIAEKLIQKGHQVRALVRKTSHVTALQQASVELSYGDLTTVDSLKRAASGVDVIFHTAAHVGDWGTRQQFYEGNVVGTQYLLKAMRAADVHRLIYLSSVAVYGRPRRHEPLRIAEDFPPNRAPDLYGQTKLEAERLVREYAVKTKSTVSILRPCVVYGPYDYKFIPRLAQALRQGKMILVGGGNHHAPIVYAEDVADLSILASEREAANGEVFNVASDEPVTWKDLLTQLAHAIGAKPPSLRVPLAVVYYLGGLLELAWKAAKAPRPPLMTRFGANLLGGKWEYDVSKADRILGFRPRVRLQEGLAKTLEWMQEETPHLLNTVRSSGFGVRRQRQ